MYMTLPICGIRKTKQLIHTENRVVVSRRGKVAVGRWNWCRVLRGTNFQL